MPQSWTFGTCFSVGFSDVGFKTTIMPGENPAGKEQRNSEGTTRRVFTFPLTNRTSTQVTDIYNFYVARKGAYEAFNITVAGNTYLVRFRKDGLSWSQFNYMLYNFGTLEMIETAA